MGDGVHFENSDEAREYLANTVGRWIQNCIDQCLNNGKPMQWPLLPGHIMEDKSAASADKIKMAAMIMGMQWMTGKPYSGVAGCKWCQKGECWDHQSQDKVAKILGGQVTGVPGCKWCEKGECWDHQGDKVAKKPRLQ